MADALKVREDRHPRLGLDEADQRLATARDDDVDQPLRAQHRRHRGAVTGGHHLDRRPGQARGAQPLGHGREDRRRGMQRIRPAAQDHRVAGLERQRARVGGDVRAAFVDHPEHPQRRRHPLDVQPVRPVPFGEHPPDRIGLRRDCAQPLGDARDPGRVEPQPVNHGGREALVVGMGEVAGVGFEDGVLRGQDRRGGPGQGGSLLRGGGHGQLGRGLARGGAHAGDQGGGGLGFKRLGRHHAVLSPVPAPE